MMTKNKQHRNQLKNNKKFKFLAESITRALSFREYEQ